MFHPFTEHYFHIRMIFLKVCKTVRISISFPSTFFVQRILYKWGEILVKKTIFQKIHILQRSFFEMICFDNDTLSFDVAQHIMTEGISVVVFVWVRAAIFRPGITIRLVLSFDCF